jgi:hypothetical protein
MMEQETPNAEAPQEQAPQLDEAKLNMLLQRIRNEQSLGRGIGAGVIAAVVGALVWGGITYATGYQIGWMAVGVGFLVGYAVRYAGKGIDNSFGAAGAILALLGCVAGNLFANCIFIADANEMAVGDVISQLDLRITAEILVETFSFFDLLFYGIAVYEGYRFSMRQLTDAELRSLAK